MEQKISNTFTNMYESLPSVSTVVDNSVFGAQLFFNSILAYATAESLFSVVKDFIFLGLVPSNPYLFAVSTFLNISYLMYATAKAYNKFNGKSYEGALTGNNFIDRSIDVGAFVMSSLVVLSASALSTIELLISLDIGFDKTSYITFAVSFLAGITCIPNIQEIVSRNFYGEDNKNSDANTDEIENKSSLKV